MRKYKIERVQRTVIDTITCNKCGVTTKRCDEKWSVPYMHSINIKPGYGSVMDDLKISFDLCDKCFSDWVLKLKILPEGIDENYLVVVEDDEI